MSIQKITSGTVHIQPAAPDDAAAIMAVKRAGWLATYPNPAEGISLADIEQKFTDEMVVTGVKNWQRGIASETAGGKRQTFIAKLNGQVVGFTSPHIDDNNQRWLGALYVAPGYQAQGIGSKLLSRALAWHGSNQDIYLHVVSYNHRAIKFYQTHGFHKTGQTRPLEFDPTQNIKLLPDTEMLRPKSAQ